MDNPVDGTWGWYINQSSYYNGRPPPWFAPAVPCGSQDNYQGGFHYDEDAPLTWLAGGFSTCCKHAPLGIAIGDSSANGVGGAITCVILCEDQTNGGIMMTEDGYYILVENC